MTLQWGQCVLFYGDSSEHGGQGGTEEEASFRQIARLLAFVDLQIITNEL